MRWRQPRLPLRAGSSRRTSREAGRGRRCCPGPGDLWGSGALLEMNSAGPGVHPADTSLVTPRRRDRQCLSASMTSMLTCRAARAPTGDCRPLGRRRRPARVHRPRCAARAFPSSARQGRGVACCLRGRRNAAHRAGKRVLRTDGAFLAVLDHTQVRRPDLRT